MNETEFTALVDTCQDELAQKQKTLKDDYNIGQYEKYWVNQETSALQFKNGEKVELEFDIVFIGTWAFDKKTWVWGWANGSIIEPVKKRSLEIQKLAEITGIDIFKTGTLEADENMAWELSALAAHVLNAIGIYRAPGRKNHLFLALIGKK